MAMGKMGCPPAETLQDLIDGRLGRLGSAAARATTNPPAALAPLRLERGTAVGRFVVIGEIGAGALGVVVSAHDPQLDRKVAIKVVHSGAQATVLRARLLREAQAMVRLSHPHVITVHEVGAIGGDVFVAMELVEGDTLAGWLAQRPRTWREEIAMFARVAKSAISDGVAACARRHACGHAARGTSPLEPRAPAKRKRNPADLSAQGASTRASAARALRVLLV
jgi:hypothetical protein